MHPAAPKYRKNLQRNLQCFSERKIIGLFYLLLTSCKTWSKICPHCLFVVVIYTFFELFGIEDFRRDCRKTLIRGFYGHVSS
jgi:hypothetical protein